MPALQLLRERLDLPGPTRALPGIAPIGAPNVGLTLTGPTEADLPPRPRPVPGIERPSRPTALTGGRLTWDADFLIGGGLPVVLPPNTMTDDWRQLNLDADRIAGMPTSTLLMVLAEASPDVSRALWDFLRLTNPGWKCTAYKPDSLTPSREGQAVVDEWVRKLIKRYGSVDVPIGRLHFGAFLRGAIFSELVLDKDGHTPIDLATPDPLSARFKQVMDPTYGPSWQLGQYHGGQWVDLSTRETITYIPIDPAPASPYGRPPAAPSIFASLFLVGLLHDLRRVVAQQGYPRYDLSIALESLRKATPPNILNSPAEWKDWVDQTVLDVQRAYNALEPDSAFVHTDVVAVGRPEGAVSAEALAGIDPLIRALERQLARALKTMPLLMGIIEGQSEANANRQWELQAAGIKAVQHLSESDLSEKATLACEANGVAATCVWRFEELRAAEKYRDAMTEGLEIDNATKLYFMGVIGQDELADRTTGEPPDQEEPRFVPRNQTPYEEGTTAAHATTTGSPRADGQPAVGKDKTPGDTNTGGDAAETGDSADPNARSVPLPVEWPAVRVSSTLPAAINGFTTTANGAHVTSFESLIPHEEQAFDPPGEPLAYVPAEVVYDAGDRRHLVRTWDQAMPEVAGLLDARAKSDEQREERISAAWQADMRADVEKLRHTVEELRIETAQPRATLKTVERDKDGRVMRVIEEQRSDGPPRAIVKTLKRDEHGEIIGVIEEPAHA